jgi:hypothetical protein
VYLGDGRLDGVEVGHDARCVVETETGYAPKGTTRFLRVYRCVQFLLSIPVAGSHIAVPPGEGCSQT